jgi:glycosyltransferase involved in cell wall biosynthesis
VRVLVVSLYYPPHAWGGYEQSCADVVDRLRARGHDVTVLTSDLRRPGVADAEGEAGAVRRELTAYFRDDDLWQPGLLGRLRVERANQRALRAALREVDPDVVAVWQLGALSMGLLTTLARSSLPLVYAVCDDWLSYGLELDPWIRAWRRRPRAAALVEALARVPATLPDVGSTGAFCFVSEDCRERSLRYSPWTFPRSAVVHSGIDLARFPPRADPADRAWGGRLLYVGRFDPRKGLETAVRALPLLPGAELEVRAAGDRAERDRLALLARDLGVADRVELAEPLPQPELARRYAAADAVVFPSEWEEPFGLVPIEAMAVGTPVAATGVGGSASFLVDGRNCVRFEPGDPAGLAAAVERLAGDAALRQRLVAGGTATARFFDVEHLADAFEAWHAHAAAGFAGDPPPERRFDIDREVARG